MDTFLMMIAFVVGRVSALVLKMCKYKTRSDKRKHQKGSFVRISWRDWPINNHKNCVCNVWSDSHKFLTDVTPEADEVHPVKDLV